jgi:hypothetical protein
LAAAPARAEVSAADAKSGIIECTDACLDHNWFGRNPDRLICFRAILAISTPAQRQTEILGVPHWVSHHQARRCRRGDGPMRGSPF